MKLKVKDLRVGNLLLFPFHNEVVEVVGLPMLPNGKQGIQVYTKGAILCEELLEQFKPIPLTEEWLLTFGITKKNGYPYKFNNGYLKIRNGVFFFNYYDIEIELPYVHTLQNLYYALTNTELTCN